MILKKGYIKDRIEGLKISINLIIDTSPLPTVLDSMSESRDMAFGWRR